MVEKLGIIVSSKSEDIKYLVEEYGLYDVSVVEKAIKESQNEKEKDKNEIQPKTVKDKNDRNN